MASVPLRTTAGALISLTRPFDSITVGLAVVLGLIVATGGEPVSSSKAAAGFALGYLLLGGVDTVNDIADRATDAISKPWRALPAGSVTGRAASWAAAVEITAALVIAAWLSPATLAISLAATAIGLAYSWRLEDVFFVKNLVPAAALMFPVAAGGAIVTLHWPAVMWWLFVMVFFATFAFEVHRDLLDREADLGRGRSTIANSMTHRTVVGVVAACYAAAYGLAWTLIGADGLDGLYVASLLLTGPLLAAGVALITGVPSPQRLRVSFLATNVAFLLALLALAADSLSR